MITAVFDCMIYLQSATNDQGPAFACLELVESNQVTLYVSPVILGEIHDVLNREEVRKKFPSLTKERAELFIQKLATIAVLLHGVPDAGVTLRDPKDLPYLNLGIAANVGYIVSWDKDLLDLMKDESFLVRHPSLHILNPVAFLAETRSRTTP
jgi:putative PIN family toxin of toxin-antitoxin system